MRSWRRIKAKDRQQELQTLRWWRLCKQRRPLEDLPENLAQPQFTQTSFQRARCLIPHQQVRHVVFSVSQTFVINTTMMEAYSLILWIALKTRNYIPRNVLSIRRYMPMCFLTPDTTIMPQAGQDVSTSWTCVRHWQPNVHMNCFRTACPELCTGTSMSVGLRVRVWNIGMPLCKARCIFKKRILVLARWLGISLWELKF